jgi:hypothetical protein
MARHRTSTRFTFSTGEGPFRFGASVGRTGVREFAGVRTGRRGWLGVSRWLGTSQRGRRRR